MGRNVRSGRGEIDLLVRLDGMVVAVEVKARVGAEPLVQLSQEKVRRMREAARAVVPRPGRIDVVTVHFGRHGAAIRWIRGFA